MELMELLPVYYKDNLTMEEMQCILSYNINLLATDYDLTINQCFVNSATNLLSRYEKIFGIQVDISKSEAFRRERIRAKIRGTGTVTKQMIKDVAKSYSNGEIEVIENSGDYSFIVKFVGSIGIPENMEALIITIEEIKPAHLSYTFEYIYNTNKVISGFKHGELSEYKYVQLREEANFNGDKNGELWT